MNSMVVGMLRRAERGDGTEILLAIKPKTRPAPGFGLSAFVLYRVSLQPDREGNQMRTLLLAALAGGLLLTPVAAKTIRTLAGTGQSGFSGDGGPGTKAQLANPYGLTLGPDGALYICEEDNHRIRRLDIKTGIISTVAGTGEQGYSGDGGPALEAKLNEPYEIRFDSGGNMFFVEMRNHLVRRVDAKTGVISTVAGIGEPGFAGDGGPAKQAQFRQPHSIALDGKGFLYVADIGNHRVRRVNLTAGTIDTFAGTGEKTATPDGSPVRGTPLNGPRAIAFDRRGDMFLALREGNTVYRIDMAGLTLHHIAGTGEQGYSGDGGPAKTAKLSGPKGIEVGPDGGVYIADTESHTIRRIDLRSGVITTVAGDGSVHDGPDGDPLKCGLARPHGIFVDRAGRIYIGDSENNRVRVLE
jgi:streptogramin lyase